MIEEMDKNGQIWMKLYELDSNIARTGIAVLCHSLNWRFTMVFGIVVFNSQKCCHEKWSQIPSFSVPKFGLSQKTGILLLETKIRNQFSIK